MKEKPIGEEGLGTGAAIEFQMSDPAVERQPATNEDMEAKKAEGNKQALLESLKTAGLEDLAASVRELDADGIKKIDYELNFVACSIKSLLWVSPSRQADADRLMQEILSTGDPKEKRARAQELANLTEE